MVTMDLYSVTDIEDEFLGNILLKVKDMDSDAQACRKLFRNWKRMYAREADASLKQQLEVEVNNMKADFQNYISDLAAKVKIFQAKHPPPAPSPSCPEPGSAWLCSEQDQTPKLQLGDQVPGSDTTLAAVSQHVHYSGHYLFKDLQQKMEEEDRAMQLQMTARDKQIRTECSQLLMVVTAVDWEHAEDVQIQEAMTKVREWRTKGYSHITRDFWEYERMARKSTSARVRDQPGSEYNNLKLHMEDCHRQLAKVIHTVDEQDRARKIGTLELMAWAELLNVPKDFIWETKPKVPLEAGLKTKHEASV